MTEPKTSSLTFRKVFPDVLAGLATFVVILSLSCGGATSVSASENASTFGLGMSHQETVVLLAAGFAAMVALNVAVFRHLMRAYVSPRRADRRQSGQPHEFGGS